MFPFVTAWMDLECIMLNEKSQAEKNKYCMNKYLLIEQGVLKISLFSGLIDYWKPDMSIGNTEEFLKGSDQLKIKV